MVKSVNDFRERLSHVIWIGGGTDSGKSSVADVIAKRFDLKAYHYDRSEMSHIHRLSGVSKDYRELLEELESASMDEWWVHPTPQELTIRSLESFQLRFLPALEDLMAFEGRVIAEGFGFTPDLLASVLKSASQAVWLVPTEQFKRDSMLRRGKPSFRDKVSDPERGTQNLIDRDALLSERVKIQAERHGFSVYTVDGNKTVDEMADMLSVHFQPYIEESWSA